MKLKLGMSKLKFSLSESHPNKMIIEGCITNIGEPSTGAPYGSDGKCIVFTPESVQNNYETYNLMPINCTFPEDFDWSPGTEVLTGHGDENIGVIEKTWIEGNELMAKIIVWKALFPDISFMVVNGQEALGFSIECLANKTHDGTTDDNLYIDDFTGVGAAILWKNTAAFSGTYIRELVAGLQKDKKDGNKMEFTKEELQAMLGEMMTKFEASISEVKTGVETMVSEVKSQVEELTVGLGETKESIKAMAVAPVTIEASTVTTPVAPAPTVIAAGQSVVPNTDFVPTVKTKAEKIAEVHASKLSTQEKLKAIVRINSEVE